MFVGRLSISFAVFLALIFFDLKALNRKSDACRLLIASVKEKDGQLRLLDPETYFPFYSGLIIDGGKVFTHRNQFVAFGIHAQIRSFLRTARPEDIPAYAKDFRLDYEFDPSEIRSLLEAHIRDHPDLNSETKARLLRALSKI